MKKITKLLVATFLATLFLSACASDDGYDAYTRAERTARNTPLKTKAQKAAHQKYILSHVVLIRMNTKGELCIGEDEDDVIMPKDFSARIRAIGRDSPGKPVLFYVDEEVATAQPKIFAYVKRECRRANLGRIYYDLPEDL